MSCTTTNYWVQWFCFWLYLFDYFFAIFCYTYQKIKNVCYTVFGYTWRFSEGMVIHFTYTWIFIKIFVILSFVIPRFSYNQIPNSNKKQNCRSGFMSENYHQASLYFRLECLNSRREQRLRCENRYREGTGPTGNFSFQFTFNMISKGVVWF